MRNRIMLAGASLLTAGLFMLTTTAAAATTSFAWLSLANLHIMQGGTTRLIYSTA
jgi:hypothetical protein